MKRAPVEIIVFSLSLSLILATVGFLVYDGLIKERKPPVVRIELKRDRVERTEGGFRLPLVLRNSGDEAVQNVMVQVTATSKTGEIESSEVVMPFLPEGSIRNAVVLFTVDPRDVIIDARTASYILP